MCGIAGFISNVWGEQELRKMGGVLSHRGPDAEGFYFDRPRGIGLAHRRLSILDLSEAGSQPFYSKDGRYVMVYNGEVYNYREIAAKYHIKVSGGSDTEVIIEAFSKVGLACINDLNGMFAMAILDKAESKLYLIRDRIGIKPLFYYHKDGNFAFASELKGILQVPIDKSVDRQAVYDFLYLGYIPGEASIFRHCRKLKPGQYAIFQNDTLQKENYWVLEKTVRPTPVTDEGSARSTLKTLLESSVQYCMISDVPLGVLLSGGVDSSVVAAIAQSQSGAPVKTFSIGFKDEKYNESHYARDVAKYIGSDHHEYVVTEQDALGLVDEILEVYDEPYGDSSAIPTLMVSQLARRHVSVALSGDGGDELFMGYGFYFWARRLSHPLVRAFHKPIARALDATGNNRLKRGSKLFDYPSLARIKSHIFSQEQYSFSEVELARLFAAPGSTSIDEYVGPVPRLLTPAEEQSFFDIKNYLPEELLVKIDRASMRHSLETRVPLLDHRLVEFAANLSPELKLKGNTGKYLLKQVLYDYVPPSYFDRPKWGFSIPLEQWLRTDLKYLIDKYLSIEVVEGAGFVRAQEVEAIKKAYFGGRYYLYNRLWLLILLHKWVKEKLV
jgi:asparagine synthase (glutamine-hydrolysing)